MAKRFRLYCRKGDAIHTYETCGANVVCLTDGNILHAANIVVWYATNEDEIMLPEGMAVDE